MGVKLNFALSLSACFSLFNLALGGFCLSLALILWPATASAQTLAETNEQAIEAYRKGDLDTALTLTHEVVGAAEDIARAQPDAYLMALNNLTFLLAEEGGTARADTALRFAQDTNLVASEQGVTALAYAAGAHAQAGNRSRSAALRGRLLNVARGTDFHGLIVTGAVDLAFENHDHEALPDLIREMIDETGVYGAQTTLDALYQRQESLEKQGDVAGVTALVDARILWVSIIQPDLSEEFAHSALWQSFFMNYEAKKFSAAAQALRDWASTGSLSREEADFVGSQAESSLLIAQLGGPEGRAEVGVGFAELMLAFAEIAYPRDDPRVGLALREVAYAQGQLGHYEVAQQTLQDAIQNLALTEKGRLSLPLVLEDLASNAWQRGELVQSAQLFQQAEAQYQKSLDEGAKPLSDMDRSILSLNRARLDIERGAVTEAQAHLVKARARFEAFRQSGAAKPIDLWHELQIKQAETLLMGEIGGDDKAVAAALSLVHSVQEVLPATHPMRARMLANAADQLFVFGQSDKARAILSEAQSVAQKSLPENAPLRVEIALKQGLDALARGTLAEVITQFRRVVQARKAPENRQNLINSRSDFEILAWALLSQPDPSHQDIDEALAALQWTQIGQSAEAYAMMEERLAAQDPALAAMIKDRQDARAALVLNRRVLTAAFATGQDTQHILARQNLLRQTLDTAELALATTGMPLLGQEQVAAMGLKEIQSSLSANEVLITFLLPSLSSRAVETLDSSSNLAIAIRANSFSVAKIPEMSRGALNKKIDAMRCEMAISDPLCAGQLASALRGTMVLEDPETSENRFDWNIAQELYSDLFAGIEGQMHPEDHVILVPPGDLLRLPFQALITSPQPEFDAATADWFVRTYAVSVLPSLAALRVLTSTRVTQNDTLRFLGVGDPNIGSAPDLDCSVFDLASLRSTSDLSQNLYEDAVIDGVRVANVNRLRQMSRLPDASCELHAIESAVGAGQSLVFTQDRATELAIKRLSASGELSNFDLLVFATHGVVAGETSAVSPGLILTPPETASLHNDGLLTAAEVAALSMSARLVILSACNTAAGSDAAAEGLSGLASGFFHAGARSLMVTHWAVYSDASAYVSSELAGAMVKGHNQSSAHALRSVILSILDDPDGTARTSHPAYWAPFAIIGL